MACLLTLLHLCTCTPLLARREQLTLNSRSKRTVVPSAEIASEAASCAADLDLLMFPQELTEHSAYISLVINTYLNRQKPVSAPLAILSTYFKDNGLYFLSVYVYLRAME